MVAANRDEFHERPTEGPALREVGRESLAANGAKIVAPRDLRAGGTWLGVNAFGVFAAITNRRSDEPDPERRSRGRLVLDALAHPSARSASELALADTAYNPFNLYLADRESAHWITYEDRAECVDLEDGVHVVGNLHPDESSPKIERLRREAERLLERGDPQPEDLAGLCRDHSGEAPFGATCVHAGEYGTRSSTLLRLGPEPLLQHSDGPPCEAPYRDLTPLLTELGLAPSSEGVRT